MISYFVTSEIWLHLEEYYNKGLTSEEAKEVIESITNPFQHYGYSTADKLQCELMGVNGNWIVKICTRKASSIQFIVDTIEARLQLFLDKKKVKKKR